MNKFVAFAVIGAAFSAPVLAAETSFSRDGQTFYVTERNMGSYSLITGHDDRGRKFDFRRVGQRVTGHYDYQFMEFTARTPAKSAEVASR